MKGDDKFAKAQFLYEYTIEYSYFFNVFFKTHKENFSHLKYNYNMESNFTKILKKIGENKNDPLKVHDMIRASVYIENSQDMINLY